jgi:hypothetical protein
MKSREKLCTQAIIASNHNTDPLVQGVEPEEEEELVNEEMITLTFIIGILDALAEVEEEVAVEVVMYPAWNKNIQVSFVPCYLSTIGFNCATRYKSCIACTFFFKSSHTI